MAWDILRRETVDSTNNVCKALAALGASDTAVIAGAQTAGKGRLGRAFQSPPGGLYLSALWRGCPAERLFSVTPMTAVAVCRAVESVCGGVCGIKWCNDVVLGGRKLCGILTEASLLPDGSAEWLVVGIGVNVGQREFPDDIAEIATSLALQGLSASADALAQAILEQLTALRGALDDQAEWLEKREEDLRELLARLDVARLSRSFWQRRLLRAFPGMRSTVHQPALERLRRRLERRGN